MKTKEYFQTLKCMLLIECHYKSGLRMTSIEKAENANYQPSKKLKIETQNCIINNNFELQGKLIKSEFSLKAEDSQS